MVTRKNIKEIIADSFFELTKLKPISKISINEIVENAGISRRTFYNNFIDKYELVDWIHWKINVEAGKLASEAVSWKEQRIHTLTLFYEKKAFYTRAYREKEYTARFEKISSEMYKAIIRQYVDIDEELDFLLDFYASGCSFAIESWVSRSFKETPEEMAVLMEKCLPAGIEKILRQNENDIKTASALRDEDMFIFKEPCWVPHVGLTVL